MDHISVEEAALYDRQIRLWGLESQKRIRNAKILLVGMEGPMIEVVKNLVLAGVGSLTLMDDKKVTEMDYSFNFFLNQKDNTGKLRVEAMRDQVHEMNPRVEINIMSKSIEKKMFTVKFLQDYDIVCCAGISFNDAIKIDNLCHQQGIPFYLAHQHGMISWVFCDAGSDYEYMMEKPKLEGNETVTVQEHCKQSWDTLKHALASWNSDHGMSLKQLKRNISPLFPIFQLLARSPIADGSIHDHFIKIENDLNIPKGFCPLETFQHVMGHLNQTFAPVAAIAGGILAQDVIKTVSRKGLPLRNILFCDGNDLSGILQCTMDIKNQ